MSVAEVLAVQRRMQAPDRSAYEAFDRIYTPLLVVAIVVAILWKVVHEAILSLTPEVSATWLPGGGLLLLLGLARFGIWQGPVSFTKPDCAFLLGGPLSRATLVRRRLRSGAVVAIGGGLLVGGVVAAGAGSAGNTSVIGVTIVDGALLMLLGAALSWHVQRSARIATLTARLTPLAVIVAVGLVVGAHHGLRRDLIWSGPWGWALVGQTTSSTAQIALGAALLAITAGAVWALAIKTAAGCSRERFEARASTRASLSAAAFTADYRSVLTTRRAGKQGGPGWAARIGLGGTAGTIVAARDLRYFAGAPLRVLAALGLMAAGTLVAVANPDRAGLVLLGAALAAAAGAALLEPMRIEVDNPDRARILLPWTYGSVLWRHCVAPIGLLATALVLAAVGAGIGGAADWGTVGIAILIGLPGAAVVALCGAMSGRRGGRLPVETVLGSAGDPSGFSGLGSLGLWLGAWPVGGTLVAAWPALAAHAASQPVSTAATGAAVNAAVAVGLRQYLLTTEAT